MRSSLLFILVLGGLSIPVNVFPQANKIDSLKHELLVANDSIRGKILYSIFVQYVHVNYDSALTYAKKSLDIALAQRDSMMIVRSYHGIGDMEHERGDVIVGIGHMKKALEISKRNEFDSRTSYLLNNLAIAETQAGNFDRALDYNFQALKLWTRDSVIKNIAISNNNIGLVYFKMNDYKKALSYFDKSFRMSMDSKNNYEDEIVLENMGYCYNRLGMFDKGIEYFKAALESCNECKPDRMITVHSGLGEGYLKIGDYNNAEDQLLQAINLSQQVGSLIHQCANLRSLAELKLLTGDANEAIQLMDKAHELASNSDLIFEKLDNLNMYATIYAFKDDYKQSFEYETKYAETLKEIFNGNRITNFSEVTSRFHEQTNLSTIENQRQLIALKEKESRQQWIVLLISIILVLLLILLSIILWRVARMKNRVNHLLDQKVRSRTLELEESYRRLEKASIEQNANIQSLQKKIQSGMATLIGVAEVAKLDIKDSKVLSYISKIELEADRVSSNFFNK